MGERIIAKVCQDKKQRRITVPKEDQTLKGGDLVELKKVEIKE